MLVFANFCTASILGNLIISFIIIQPPYNKTAETRAYPAHNHTMRGTENNNW